MSKKVEEFVKRAKEIDEMARVKIDTVNKLNNEVEELTIERAEQCEKFMQECTEEEFNELLLMVNDDDKLMYLGMKKLTDIFKDIIGE